MVTDSHTSMKLFVILVWTFALHFLAALHRAAEKLNVDEIKRLVADGADLTALDEVKFSSS